MRHLFQSLKALILISVVVSCTDSEPTTLYTYQSPDICGCGPVTQNFLYATDDYGNILDVKPFSKGQTIRLQTYNSVLPPRVNLTWVYYNELYQMNIQSIFGLPAGGVELYTPYKGKPTSPVIGQFNVTIKNLAINQNEYWLGFQLTTDDRASYYQDVKFNPFQMTVGYSRDARTLFVSAPRSDQPVYFEKDITTDRSNLVIDVNNDFIPLKNSVKLFIADGFSTYGASVVGMKNSLEFYQFQQQGVNIGTSEIPLYYNPGYDYYHTTYSFTTNAEKPVTISYEKWGSVPIAATVPQYNFVLGDKSLLNFTYDFSTPSPIFSSSLTFETIPLPSMNRKISWSINSRTVVQFRLEKIVADLKQRFPGIELDALRYKNDFSIRVAASGDPEKFFTNPDIYERSLEGFELWTFQPK